MGFKEFLVFFQCLSTERMVTQLVHLWLLQGEQLGCRDQGRQPRGIVSAVLSSGSQLQYLRGLFYFLQQSMKPTPVRMRWLFRFQIPQKWLSSHLPHPLPVLTWTPSRPHSSSLTRRRYRWTLPWSHYTLTETPAQVSVMTATQLRTFRWLASCVQSSSKARVCRGFWIFFFYTIANGMWESLEKSSQ